MGQREYRHMLDLQIVPKTGENCTRHERVQVCGGEVERQAEVRQGELRNRQRQLQEDTVAFCKARMEERVQQRRKQTHEATEETARIAREVAREYDRLQAERARERRTVPTEAEYRSALEAQMRENEKRRQMLKVQEEAENARLHARVERVCTDACLEDALLARAARDEELRRDLEEQIKEKQERRRREQEEEERLNAQIAREVAREAELLRDERERERRARGANLETPASGKDMVCKNLQREDQQVELLSPMDPQDRPLELLSSVELPCESTLVFVSV